MNAVLFLNGLGYLAIALMAFYMFFAFSKKSETIERIGKVFGVNGIFHMMFGFLALSWALGFLEPTKNDFVLVSFVVTVVSSILTLYAVYKITSNRNLIYLFVLFLTTIFAINQSINYFFLFSMVVSHLLMMIVFLDLVFFSNLYLKKAGFAGIFYALISIFFVVMVFANYGNLGLPWFIPNVLMFLVLYFIFLDVKNLGVIEDKRYAAKKKKSVLNFAGVFGKFFVFITAMSAFIFLSTVALHEFGHAMIAQYYGCENTRAIIYDVAGGSPSTETICGSNYNDLFLTLGGIVATIAIGLVFLLTGGEFTTRLSYIIFGFGLLISYNDLVELGLSKSILTSIMLISIVMIAIAIVRLSGYYLRQQEIFKEGLKQGVKRIYDGEREVKKIVKYEVEEEEESKKNGKKLAKKNKKP
jgi:hypothetical protein